MDPQSPSERFVAAVTRIAIESERLRADFDEHRTEVRDGFKTVEGRLKSLEELKARREGAAQERGRLAAAGKALGTIVVALFSVDLVGRYAHEVGHQLLPGWFK